jgi:hypothetical protein
MLARCPCRCGGLAARAGQRSKPDQDAMHPPAQDAAVAAKLDACPPAVRTRLLALRRLIFDVARATPGVGAITETLKWGQPAYLTAETGAGSTVRIDWQPATPGHYAIYFHCQTNLVETFRTLFAADLRFEGRRAIVLDAAQALPEDVLSVCIRAALTYHLKPPARPAGRRRAAVLPPPR